MSLATSIDEAKVKVEKLVERFAQNLDVYKRSNYRETQVRIEYIDPFFEALGWDVRNTKGCAEQYKDVVHEDALKTSGSTRSPDYSFRIGGLRKFFLEAKKPSVAIRSDIGPAYQLRRYAWSAKLPLSILTDFEELALYDCQKRPRPGDVPSLGRIMYYTYDQYLDHFDDIYSVFSHESLLKGSFDRYLQDTKGKRGTSEVNSEFLKEIEGWRDILARNIALRNPGLSVHELNFAVQRTIDRIIFLRMCEDRGIEDYGRLLALGSRLHVYSQLRDLFRQADEKYNAGLFDFQGDTLTPTLAVDDKVLKPILYGLYYPQSPYEFSVLSTDVLGQVYEQFLGKVIRLTPAHRAIVEEKPEVKKAGGVFYTPTFIVEYIVKQTVGSLLEGKTPRQISRLHILDPACGSGSFLLGAYQYLLDYHLQWYEANIPDRHSRGKRPAIYQGPKGGWRLTAAEKKRILLNNIFGVDIDLQAVEVTKLSLLLKVLEGETDETLSQQLVLWRERALPDLSKNIKCGNSLIGPDYFGAQLLPDEEEMRRVNAFDWQVEFPEVISTGGFDVVIGNPPYIRIQTIQEWTPGSADYFKRIYRVAYAGNYDIYVVFVERGLSLLKGNGKLGFIIPQKFWHVHYGKELRGLLLKQKNVEGVVNFGYNQVFDAAFINTCILILSKAPSASFNYTEVRKAEKGTSLYLALKAAPVSTLPSQALSEGPWVLKPASTMKLLEKLARQGQPLEKCTKRIFQGLKTSADKIYVLRIIKETSSLFIAHSLKLDREVELERGLCHKLIKGTEMRPFAPLPARRIILFPYLSDGKSMRLMEEKTLEQNYPKINGYLKENEKYLRNRESGKMNHKGWYGYGRTQALNVISLPKIVTPDLAPFSSFLFDTIGDLYFLGGAAGGYGILPRSDVNPLYLLGLLNSRVLNFFITSSGQQMESGYYSFEARFIRSVPIHTIDFDDILDVGYHDKIVTLVKLMLDLYKKLASASITEEKILYQRQIDAADARIDALVNELYGLTEDEIKIVEDLEQNGGSK